MVILYGAASNSSVSSSHFFISHSLPVSTSGIPSKDIQPKGGQCSVKHWKACSIPHNSFLKANMYNINLYILKK
jgi:hypothetical protein